MDTKDRIFYHGTSKEWALGTLKSELKQSPLEAIGAFTLARSILGAIRANPKIKDKEYLLIDPVFSEPGMEDWLLCKSALLGLESEDESYFDYGQFYATLNVAVAYRYTLGNPYRSEFIAAIVGALRLLDKIGDPLSRTIERDFPEVFRLINDPSPPIVLELSGIAHERLSTASGRGDVASSLELFDLIGPNGSTPADFRVKDVQPVDIIAIHDLGSWPVDQVHDVMWTPDRLKVRETRHPAKEWLARIANP